MKLLLDLLAATSGIAPCLKLLCMFDRNLRKMTEVSNLTIDSYYNSEKDRTEAVVKFDDAPALKDIFVKIRDVQCIYSVVINPPINKVRMIFFISLLRFWEDLWIYISIIGFCTCLKIWPSFHLYTEEITEWKSYWKSRRCWNGRNWKPKKQNQI